MKTNTEQTGPDELEPVTVLAILPFWRYALGPTSQNTPAIPFYRLASARAFFHEAAMKLPFSGVTLYRCRWWGGLEVIDEYIPNGRAEDF